MQAGWKYSLRPSGRAWQGLVGWLALTAMAGCSLDRTPQAGDSRDQVDSGTGQAASGGVGGLGGVGGVGGIAGMAGSGATGGIGGIGGTGGTGGSSGIGGIGGTGGTGGSGGTGGTALAPNGCKPTDNCQLVGAFGSVCVDATTLPPSCIMASDCAAYGPSIPCSVLPFGLFCIVTCTP